MQYLCEGERYVSGVPGTEVEAVEPGGAQLRVWKASWEVAEAWPLNSDNEPIQE